MVCVAAEGMGGRERGEGGEAAVSLLSVSVCFLKVSLSWDWDGAGRDS